MTRITVDLTYSEVVTLFLALHDLTDGEGKKAWDHPLVRGLRVKIADAITVAERAAA